MNRLSILVFFALSSGAFAQETSCVSRSQFLKGEFSSDSVPCEPAFAAPLKYCNASPLDPLKSIEYLTELDFRDYLLYDILQSKDADIAARIAGWDGVKLKALLDEKNPEDAAAVFWVLATAIISEELNQLAAKAEVDTKFRMLINRETESRFFIRRLPQSVSKLRRIYRCIARCGDTSADIEKLTRSRAFSSCVGGL